MQEQPLEALSDLVTEAHTRLQQTQAAINPVVGLRRGMRDGGFPADVITVDCLSSQRRIVLILHDDHPGQLIYQFATLDEDTDNAFRQMALADISAQQIQAWMQDYFSGAMPPA